MLGWCSGSSQWPMNGVNSTATNQEITSASPTTANRLKVGDAVTASKHDWLDVILGGMAAVEFANRNVT